MLSEEQAERMRKATAIRFLKRMSWGEIDCTLQRLKDQNDRLKAAISAARVALDHVDLSKDEGPQEVRVIRDKLMKVSTDE